VLTAELFLHFEVFVRRILVTVDLHIRDVPFLGCGRLIDLDETLSRNREYINRRVSTMRRGRRRVTHLAVRASRAASLEYRDAHNRGRHKCYAGERERKVDGSTLSVVHLSPHGIALQQRKGESRRFDDGKKKDSRTDPFIASLRRKIYQQS